MKREEEINKKSEVGSRKMEVGSLRSGVRKRNPIAIVSQDRSRKVEVAVQLTYCGVKLNSEVLSSGFGRSTTMSEAMYHLGSYYPKVAYGVLSLSLQLNATMPKAKYHLGGDYPKVAHGVLLLSLQLSETMLKAKYHLGSDYPKVAHRVLSLSSGQSTNLSESKYGLEADCIAVSRQLSITKFDIIMRLAVQSRLQSGRLAPGHVVNFSVDFSQATTKTNAFGLQPHILKMGLKPVSLFSIASRKLKPTACPDFSGAIEKQNFNSFLYSQQQCSSTPFGGQGGFVNRKLGLPADKFFNN